MGDDKLLSEQLILASRSSVRARILADAGLAFEAVPAVLNETALLADLAAEGLDNAAKARRLAEAKALAVSGREAHCDALVIGADQILDLHGAAFEAPVSKAEARERLLKLRGRRHRLLSGVALARGGAVIGAAAEAVTIEMRRYSEAELDRYLALASESDLETVGGYALEARGAVLVERIDGDWFSALGLPLFPLLEMLRRAGHSAGL